MQEGFAKHPWVAQVEKVEVVPPRSVRVALAYRQPVLAVVVTPDLAEPNGQGRALRAVDDRRTVSSFADAIGLETFDQSKAREGGDLRVKSAERLRDAVVTALGKIHAVLDSGQRA